MALKESEILKKKAKPEFKQAKGLPSFKNSKIILLSLSIHKINTIEFIYTIQESGTREKIRPQSHKSIPKINLLKFLSS